MHWLGGCISIGLWILFFSRHYKQRCSEAERITRYWLEQNGYAPPVPGGVKSNAWCWPVRVTVDVVDGGGQPVRLTLRVGGLFGGVFSGKVECDSVEPRSAA